MYENIMDENTRILLRSSVMDRLWEHYTCRCCGLPVRGQAVSALKKVLYEEGWKGLGHTEKFVGILEELGFEIEDCTNTRGGRARVVIAPVTSPGLP